MADYVFVQHGYLVLKDAHTICYVTRYIAIYKIDWYSNITKDMIK